MTRVGAPGPERRRARRRSQASSRAVHVQPKYHTKETWQDRDGRPLHPHTDYYVGGNTKC
jgi:hypothetical protein